MIRVLSLGYHDACGVSTGHRDALAKAHPDIDYRVAIWRVQNYVQARVDWWAERVEGWVPDGRPLVSRGSLAGLHEFAAEADVIQICPGQGEPSEYERTLGLATPDFKPGAKLVAFFHGSRETWSDRSRLARYWMGLGAALATSIVDYAVGMPEGAKILPPAIRPKTISEARREDDPLVVIQAPTDMSNSGTAEFLEGARACGAISKVIHRRPHREVIEAKARAHVGWDRFPGPDGFLGGFYVNTLENASMGLAALCSLRPEFGAELDRQGFKAPPGGGINTPNQLAEKLALLVRDHEALRVLRRDSHTWWYAGYRPAVIADRLARFYREVADA